MEARTLLLNAHMGPHSIATWQQAITLLYQKKIDVLENYEATVSSPSITLHIPAVARLRREIAGWKKGVKFSRVNVRTRDGMRCAYCGRKHRGRNLNNDHVIPRVKGGKTTFENIVTACYPCNTRKGGRTPEEAGMRMHFRPYQPDSLPLAQPILFDLDKVPDLWRPYLGEILGAFGVQPEQQESA